ncbi:hypothetical protein F3Y22_tig00001644pilonHSYRG00324 [Hibiscus syriacus]|uniref:BED-type domain-containing protein n=1 Tax=Hibiscus syriacus TaxID=106335 RepID=A0A6A3CWY8_HIBSY|nr:hypothetical protein F3Y22_tig00001644pilonHSYRG00324 [Hibiscus syriacus]
MGAGSVSFFAGRSFSLSGLSSLSFFREDGVEDEERLPWSRRSVMFEFKPMTNLDMESLPHGLFEVGPRSDCWNLEVLDLFPCFHPPSSSISFELHSDEGNLFSLGAVMRVWVLGNVVVLAWVLKVQHCLVLDYGLIDPVVVLVILSRYWIGSEIDGRKACNILHAAGPSKVVITSINIEGNLLLIGSHLKDKLLFLNEGCFIAIMEGQRSIDDNSDARAQAQSQAESNNMTQSSPMPNNQGPSISPIEEEQTQIDDSNVGTNSRKRKLTSVVWNHFEKVNVNGEDKAKCRYCKKKLGANSKNGTRHWHDHFKSCPKRTCRDIRQQVPSRNTLKNDILKIYDFEKEKTMRLLEKNRSKIAIMTDMWTSSNQKKGFMSITSHLIDDNWEMQSQIMRFIYVPCPHTAEVLADVLYESLCDWNIDRKISTVTVDNCSTNDLMIHLLLDKLSLNSLILGGELFHMRCCAHILNLIVQDGLSVIGDGIERIRDSVYFWSVTQKRIEKFEEAARHLTIDCSKKLSLDRKTRWNSTYLMLSVAIVYKDVFKRLKKREAQYRSLPTDRDWELASSICGKLQLFYKVTLMFSGTKYPTANVFFPSICEIRITLSKWSEDRDEVIKAMGERMLVKFDKYWSVIHGVMGVAVILDPRYKFKMMEYAFPKIYGFEKSDVEIVKLKVLVSRLFQDYETCIMSELDHYLQEKVRTQNSELDILSWWKTNGFKYPTLQKIARDILAIPISTVTSESAFSTSGRLVSPHRSRLHPKTLEALMCAQSWLINEIRATCSQESVAYCKSIEYDRDDGDEQLGVITV